MAWINSEFHFELMLLPGTDSKFNTYLTEGCFCCTVKIDRFGKVPENHDVLALFTKRLFQTAIFRQNGITYVSRRVKNVIQANIADERIISNTFLIAWPAK